MSWIPGTRSTQRSQHTTYAVVIPVAQYKIGHTARGWVGRFAAGAVAGVATVAFALVLPGSGLAQTVTFGVGGATWTVPPGVHFISAAATGASGGYDGAVPSAC